MQSRQIAKRKTLKQTSWFFLAPNPCMFCLLCFGTILLYDTFLFLLSILTSTPWGYRYSISVGPFWLNKINKWIKQWLLLWHNCEVFTCSLFIDLNASYALGQKVKTLSILRCSFTFCMVLFYMSIPFLEPLLVIFIVERMTCNNKLWPDSQARHPSYMTCTWAN